MRDIKNTINAPETQAPKKKGHKGVIISIILVIIIIVTIWMWLGNRGKWICENGEWIMQGKTDELRPTEACQGDEVQIVGRQKPSEEMIKLDSEKIAEGINIRVKTPHVNATVISPIKITGEAKDWYVKDAFIVELIGKNGEVLGEGTAEALEEVGEDNYIAFEAEIKFKVKDAKSGDIIFYRSDPTGGSKSVGTFSFPVFFE